MSADTKTGGNAWKRFWGNGGWWKAVVIFIAYWLVYQGVSWVGHRLFGDLVVEGGLFATPLNLFIGQVFSILVTGILVLLLAWSFGWVGEIFGPQPVKGSWWMWLAVVVVLGFNAIRFLAVDYQAVGVGMVLMTLFLGLCVGFTEELVYRGVIVQLLRRQGLSEWVVAAVSSLLFGLSHALNYIGTTDIVAPLVHVAYTTFFAVLMYLTMRVTGSIVWAMLIHGSTDASLFLITGSLSTPGQVGDASPLMPLVNISNPAAIVAGLVLIIFIRGKVGRAHYGLPEKGATAVD